MIVVAWRICAADDLIGAVEPSGRSGVYEPSGRLITLVHLVQEQLYLHLLEEEEEEEVMQSHPSKMTNKKNNPESSR